MRPDRTVAGATRDTKRLRETNDVMENTADDAVRTADIMAATGDGLDWTAGAGKERGLGPAVNGHPGRPPESRRADAGDVVMTSGVDASWFSTTYRAGWLHRDRQGRPRLPTVVPRYVPWPHDAEGVVIPMPGEQALTALVAEYAAKPYGAAMGPLATDFRQKVVRWAAALTVRFQDGLGTITGALGRAIDRWGSRIAHLRSKLRTNSCVRWAQDAQPP